MTRAADGAAELAERLRARGATPVEAPTIHLGPAPAAGPLDAAIREAAAGGCRWVVFTSAAGVRSWFDRAASIGVDPPRIEALVAAVGAGTAESLRERGIVPDLVPMTFTTDALGRAFPRGEGRVLLARADIAPGELEERLRGKGWTAVRVAAYATRPARSLPAEARRALRAGRVDGLTFTSASTVDGFVRLAGVVRGPRVVCIGPTTARAARRAGFVVHAVARPHTIEGLVEALERAMKGRTPR